MISMTRMMLATAAALCLLSGVASADDAPRGTETIYLSQSGTGTGASCASPRSAAWFNTASNWTSTRAVDGKIGPNDTVRLCGTITSDLTFQGDGTSGNYITVDGTGATMNANFAAGANKSYGTIRNVTWINDFGGEPFTCTSCDNFIFRNNSADNWHGGNFVLITEDGANQQPHHVTIANNYLRTSTGNYGDVQKDIIKCASCTDTIVEGNHLEMRIVGAAPFSRAHDDVIQSFRKGGSSLGPPRDLTVRYNKIVMNATESAHRSWCILEHLGGTNYFYGNLFLGIRGADGANGCAIYNGQSGVVHHFVGNTVVAKVGASNDTLKLLNNGTINIRGNVFYTGGNQGYALSMATVNRSNNLWFGARAPACVAGEICGQDPKFTDYANNDFSLLSVSPANANGANLGAPYNTALASGATWPNPNLAGRPASGDWEMGAFQIGGGVPPPSGEGVPLPSGNLVAAYNFDEGSGTTVTDRSGAGNLGTLSGPTWNTIGKYGGSLSFDGVDDYVDFGDINAAEGSTKLSVSYWVKPQTLKTRDMHISKWKHIAAEPNTENVWAVRTQNTATDEVYIFIGNGNDGGNNYFWSTDLDLPAGAWTHLSFVYDGAGAVNADRLKLYKNGAQVSGRFTGTIPATMNSGARSVSIAQLTEGNGYFPGSIDDVRIYNRVLTPSEVTTDMNTAIGGAPPSPRPLAFAVGDRIRTAENVNVRASGSLSASILGTQPTGSRGRIIGGPASADRITWWQMDYDNAPDGWSGQDHFTK